MQCIDQRVVHLQHGFATSENDKALTLCLAPELKRSVSQRLCACKFAATLARRADEIGVAETADSFRTVLLPARSEEHTSELQSLMRISYAVFCLKKKKHQQQHNQSNN